MKPSPPQIHCSLSPPAWLVIPQTPQTRHTADPANTAHIRQSRPDFTRGFKVRVLKTFYSVPSSLGRLPSVLPGTEGCPARPPADPTLPSPDATMPEMGLQFMLSPYVVYIWSHNTPCSGEIEALLVHHVEGADLLSGSCGCAFWSWSVSLL